jgi:hypothetical protein
MRPWHARCRWPVLPRSLGQYPWLAAQLRWPGRCRWRALPQWRGLWLVLPRWRARLRSRVLQRVRPHRNSRRSGSIGQEAEISVERDGSTYLSKCPQVTSACGHFDFYSFGLITKEKTARGKNKQPRPAFSANRPLDGSPNRLTPSPNNLQPLYPHRLRDDRVSPSRDMALSHATILSASTMLRRAAERAGM